MLHFVNQDIIKKSLTSELVPHIDDTNTKHAAVLIVIYGQDCKIIMTQKPMTMSQHAGEISFPGGKLAQDDAHLLDTALRETQEEISLNVNKESVIGQLAPVTTRNSGYTIIPFITMLDEIPELSPNSEVDEILHIPLFPLLHTLGADDNLEHRSLFEAYKLTYQDKIIWGASARMLKQISDIFNQYHLL